MPAPAALLLGALFGCNGEPQGTQVADSARASPSGVTEMSGTRSEAANAAPSPLPRAPLRIVSGERTHLFQVEIAQTPEEQAQGLMFRRSLAADAGMLFPFNPPRPAGFWMKNTFIPLDMIFIAPGGTIERIAANTVPHSEENVSSRGEVIAVLELAGGRAAELGLKEGDRVIWPGGPPAP
jgi:uncharacterized membrane protein (UPF0127 family)